MAAIRRIVVAIGAEHQYQRSVIAGIAQAPSRQREGWELVLAPGLAQRSEPWPLAWRPDGILAWTTCDQAHAALAATAIPFEDLSGGDGRLPNVRTDLPAICRLAIDHLLACGYRQLAIADIPGDPYRIYAGAMAAEAGRRGLELASHPLPWREVGRDPLGQVAGFAAWLAGLPRPIGLLCHAGGQALSAAAACRCAGLEIPDDVGLLTSDDEPLGNLLAAVPLSAVGKPEALVGERLAERLARRLAGRDPGPPEVLAPTGIIARASTELGRLGDPLVVRALDWMAAHLAEPIGVEAVARAAGVSRRALERHFRDVRRTTVLAEIQRLRVARAMVLVEGGATVAAAAAAAGMSSSALYKRFQRQYHGSPAAWAEGVRAPAR
ncbi:MAG: substrate-binding domain-containing protein [Planctomycetes bacterium]|nr:substrate-binding domain-containing protein [Planctomycetota bacterium]